MLKSFYEPARLLPRVFIGLPMLAVGLTLVQWWAATETAPLPAEAEPCAPPAP